MRKFLRFRLCTIWLALLAGCAGLPSLAGTPSPVPVLISTQTPTATVVASPTLPLSGGARSLLVWMPPQFAPSADTAASKLLQARLDAFAVRRPGLQVEVRVKAGGGANGMLESLMATDAAAPEIMPDLVILSRAELESAALQGLLHPLDGLTTALDNPDWYPYSQQMAHLQNTAFGLPFAGDALVLAGYSIPLPENWNSLDDKTYLFPASDPLALFSLGLYLSRGGSLVDDQGRPQLDEGLTAEALSFYAQSVATGNLSSSVLVYQDNAAAWQALKERRASMAVIWASSYLVEKPPTISLSLLPGLGEDPIVLSSGYLWALAGTEPAKHTLAIELAEFLSASDFLAEWSEAAGVLPTRPTALLSWKDASAREVLMEVGESAQLVPEYDLLGMVGPAFQQAVEAVLSGDELPAEAARNASEQLK